MSIIHQGAFTAEQVAAVITQPTITLQKIY
jgi:hypothetical protein